MELRDKLARRAAKAGVSLSDSAAAKMAEYFELLRKWNRKVALTSLPVETSGDEAIDRLLIEPIVAVKYLPKPASAIIDIGSGGGSPAIPIKVTAPEASMRMVESKTRKVAFLREAIRILESRANGCGAGPGRGAAFAAIAPRFGGCSHDPGCSSGPKAGPGRSIPDAPRRVSSCFHDARACRYSRSRAPNSSPSLLTH